MDGWEKSGMRFGGSSEPSLSIKDAIISLFSSTDTSLSKKLKPTNSSDKYHRWRPNAVTAASAMVFCGYKEREYSSARSFLRAVVADGV